MKYQIYRLLSWLSFRYFIRGRIFLNTLVVIAANRKKPEDWNDYEYDETDHSYCPPKLRSLLPRRATQIYVLHLFLIGHTLYKPHQDAGHIGRLRSKLARKKAASLQIERMQITRIGRIIVFNLCKC